jgi:putative SbcD/Mre11-related phosphoesterase
VIVIRGNHDNYLKNISGKRKFAGVEDFYVVGRYCFLHGDRDFPEIYDKKIKTWIIGHAHPALRLSDGIKTEKYKCFLEGEYKKKRIMIVPSFAEYFAGSDPRQESNNLAWGFNLSKFKARVVGDRLEVLDFGKLEKIK